MVRQSLDAFVRRDADLARRVSAAPHAAWFYALVRPDGTPINVGPIRRRPTVSWHCGGTPTYDKVEVWLLLTLDDFAALAAHPPPGWEQVITDLIHRVARTPDGAPNGDPDDRLPSTMLRRWLAVRDRRCVFPGCRIAPHRCDIDHTIEHHKGGPTIDTNLGPCCRPDHRLRHDYGWTVEQIRAGHFVWTSPSGHEYERLPPPGPEQALAPMPEPTTPGEDHLRE